MATTEALVEHVILLDPNGLEIGTAAKDSVRGPDTSFHLAFSCYVFNDLGEVLLTRRALTKKAWPGAWTNSFCGHPLPAEPLMTAVTRRARFELDLGIDDLSLALPLFRYRATDSSGTARNELCPVYLATTSDQPEPNPLEVMEYRWADPSAVRSTVLDAPWAFSPWLVLQVRELERFHA